MSGGGQPVKLFVGGLPPDLTDDEFRQHFAAYGTLSDCTIMRDSLTGTSRGFGFIVFESGNCAQQCLGSAPHQLRGKVVDAKLAVPRDRMGSQPGQGGGGRPMGGMMTGGRGGGYGPRPGGGDSGKVFVGGLAHEVVQSDLDEFFSQFGEVSSTMLMTDRVTGKSRGFGFVTFAGQIPKGVVSPQHEIYGRTPHQIDGHTCGCHKYVPGGTYGPQGRNALK